MPGYDAERFDPPAPLALVDVDSELLGVAIHDVPMLLDTGADVTLLPRSHVTSLISAGAELFELEAFDGTKSFSPAITCELSFLGKKFRGQFLLVDSWHGVLGRNVLNNLSILFNGPSKIWMEHR